MGEILLDNTHVDIDLFLIIQRSCSYRTNYICYYVVTISNMFCDVNSSSLPTIERGSELWNMLEIGHLQSYEMVLYGKRQLTKSPSS